MVSMKDISVACGVSVATVSKALNDHGDIGAETKKRVRQAAKEMGYFPNSAAKALKTNRTHNLGVLFEEEDHSGLTHDYFAYVLDSLKNAAEEKGYDITFINGCRTRPNRMSYLEHCRYRGFDGVIIVCVNFYDPEVMELARSDIPMVTIDHLFNNVCAVMSDNVKGMHELLRFIYDKGHRKIAYIHGTNSYETVSSVTQSRLSSFYKTATELGLDIPDEYIRQAAYRDSKGAYAETEKLLDLKNRPTCILYPDDFACYGGINAIRERGLSVPEDISVAGFDGIRIARHIEPKLTTLKQDTARLGRQAAEKVISLIEHPKTTLIEQIVVEGEVYVGGSVAELK
ncbi:MAG: LacI family transcriptional regulator [Lachnospiraceae bacterium]|nr:LacI family transcriptional regulator [Lachnospiraceae bacterium]